MNARHGVAMVFRPSASSPVWPTRRLPKCPNRAASAPFCSSRPFFYNFKVHRSGQQRKYDNSGVNLSDQVRLLMRLNPNPVVAVVTPSSLRLFSHLLEEPDQPKLSHAGLLVSSFNTVTLEPLPYVSFNIRQSSYALEIIERSGTFTVTGLVKEKSASAFAGKAPDQVARKREEGKDHDLEDTQQWPQLPSKDDPGGRSEWHQWIGRNGQVNAEKGGTWWMRCKYSRRLRVDVGDHAIVIGEVLQTGWVTRAKMRKTEEIWDSDPFGPDGPFLGGDIQGLIYWNGRYHQLTVKDGNLSSATRSKWLKSMSRKRSDQEGEATRTEESEEAILPQERETVVEEKIVQEAGPAKTRKERAREKAAKKQSEKAIAKTQFENAAAARADEETETAENIAQALRNMMPGH